MMVHMVLHLHHHLVMAHHLHHTMNQDMVQDPVLEDLMVQAHVVHTVHMVGKKNRHSKFMNF